MLSKVFIFDYDKGFRIVNRFFYKMKAKFLSVFLKFHIAQKIAPLKLSEFVPLLVVLHKGKFTLLPFLRPNEISPRNLMNFGSSLHFDSMISLNKNY